MLDYTAHDVFSCVMRPNYSPLSRHRIAGEESGRMTTWLHGRAQKFLDVNPLQREEGGASPRRYPDKLSNTEWKPHSGKKVAPDGTRC